MIFDNCNPFTKNPNNQPELKYACYYFNYLFNVVMSLYDWTGKEFEPGGSLNRDYLEWALNTQGHAGFFLDKDKKIRGLLTTRVGLDPYNFPTTLQTSNPVLGDLKGVIGVNAVWVRNNRFAVPTISTIRHFAEELAKVEVSLNVNLTNSRDVKIYQAETDAQAQQIRKAVDDISKGKPGIILKPDLAEQIMSDTGSGSVPVFGTPSEYLVDKYIQDKRSIMNDFFVAFGVNASGANIIKKERNLTSEVDSNNQEIEVNKSYWLETREQACREVKEVLGFDIDVKLREPRSEEYLPSAYEVEEEVAANE